MIRLPQQKIGPDTPESYVEQLLAQYAPQSPDVAAPVAAPAPVAGSDEALLNPEAGPAAPLEAPAAPGDDLDALIADESSVMDEEAKKEAQRAKVVQLYTDRANAPKSSGPGTYEKIFRETHSRPSAASRILGAFGSGNAGRYAASGQDSYDEGLAAAMTKDAEEAKSSDYIDQASAELLHKYLGLDLEQAANVRKNSQVMGLVNNLGGIDAREREYAERGKDRDLQRELMQSRYDEDRALKLQLANQSDATRRYGIDKRKGSGGSGGGGGKSPDMLAAIDSYVVKQVSGFGGGDEVTLEQVQALREGDTASLAGMDPKLVGRVKGALIDAQSAAKYDAKKFIAANLTAGGREAGNVDAPGKNAEVDRADPQQRAEARRWINSHGPQIKTAMVLYNAMTPGGRELLAKLPATVEGPDWSSFLRNSLATDADKKAARAIQELQNVITKERSGAAVANKEMSRLYSEFGQGIQSSSTQMREWLKSLKDQYELEADNLERTYGNLFED